MYRKILLSSRSKEEKGEEPGHRKDKVVSPRGSQSLLVQLGELHKLNLKRRRRNDYPIDPKNVWFHRNGGEKGKENPQNTRGRKKTSTGGCRLLLFLLVAQ